MSVQRTTEHTDVAIVGAGAVGLCAAYFLQQAGCRVTVLTREAVGEGASAGNAGMIAPSHVVPLAAPGVVAKGLRWLTNPESPFYIKPRFDLDLARWLWQFRAACTPAHVTRSIPVLRDLSLASTALFEAMQADLGDFGFAQTGLLMLYHTEKGRKENLQAADLAEAAGLQVERLDADTVRSKEPALRTPATGAVYYRQDGRADPDRFLQRLAETLQARGVRIHAGTTVQDLAADDDAVTIRTTRQTLRAQAVVLAAGAWTPRLAKHLGLRIPLQPAKGYSITRPAPSDGPHLPMILTEEKQTVTPLPGRIRFTGTLTLVGFDASVEARRAAPIRRLAQTYAGNAAAQADVWTGYRPCTPDGLPVIGRSPRHRNVIVATGHGMMGLMLAPVTGRLVAEHVQGLEPSHPSPLLSLERFL